MAIEKSLAVSLDRLYNVLQYDPDKGEFYWRERTGTRVRIGDRAGSFQYSRRSIRIDGSLYRAARIAWAMYYNIWPPLGFEIDHINGDVTDDRIKNLRLVTHAQNTMNNNKRRDNKSGTAGVIRTKEGNFRAFITIKRAQKNLGTFKTLTAAVSARKTAEKQFFGEYAREDK